MCVVVVVVVGHNQPLLDPIVLNIARRLDVSPAAVLVKWSLQQGVAVIPRTASVEHMRDNLNAASAASVQLTGDDISALNAIAYLITNPKYVV